MTNYSALIKDSALINNAVLIVVDMLYDFIDGSLACKNADDAVKHTLEFIKRTRESDLPVIFIRDRHPANHCSFTENGGIWPAHCVAGTRGGEIHSSLSPYATEDLTVDTGTDPHLEQYSGFEAINIAGQNLEEVVDMLECKDVYVCGIATEYCVRNTCEDLSKAGHHIILLEDCLAYVDLDGHTKAIEEMRSEGIVIQKS